TTPPADIRGEGIGDGFGPAPIVHARDYDGIPANNSADGKCASPFPANTFSNINGNGPAIVMCEDGLIGSDVKSNYIMDAGGGGVVMARPSLLMYGGLFEYSLPGMRIQSDDAALLRTWLASGSGHMATISGSSVSYDIENGDHIINASSRGPNPTVPSVIRPDVIAPGWVIVSAVEGNEYTLGLGTSFASPAAAGAAALIQVERPGWSAAEVQSAIVSTAIYTYATKADWVTPADPFDVGAGRVYVADAINAGLLFDESVANFMTADPARNGDPEQLNLATLAQADCVAQCQWVRTVSNALATTGSWTVDIHAPAGISLTVSPSSFSLAPGATQSFTVTATINGAAEGSWQFGR
ncbi:MAG: S8 family serine peptidase, partial [Anaerolineales bacterium]|nr:S8 family serine peptidase [Anaerolineales bacterium]